MKSPTAAWLPGRVWWCALALLLGITTIAGADHPITVSGMNNLAFGTLFRNSTSSVGYSSNNAARFTVSGKKRKWVTLMVTVNSLSVGSGSSADANRRMMTPAISASNCQYSLDGGATWQSFSSASGRTAWVVAQFPTGSGSEGTIHVRVGASLSSSSVQQRGNYSGSVDLVASYISGSGNDDDDDDDGDGNHGHGNDDDHDDDDNPGQGGGNHGADG